MNDHDKEMAAILFGSIVLIFPLLTMFLFLVAYDIARSFAQ